MPFDLTLTVGAASTAQIQSLTTSDSGAAPVAMQFWVDAATLTNFTPSAPTGNEIHDRRRSGLYYYWDFGDAYDFVASADTVNAAHLNAGTAHGFLGTHVFRTPGNYSVTCLIVDPVNGYSETASTQITVGDPDSLFTADNQTIVVDPQNRIYAPYPNAEVVTSVAQMVSRVKGFNDALTPRRVIFRRGETYPSSGFAMGVYSLSTLWPTTHMLAADEPGAKPIIDQSGGMGHNPAPASANIDLVFQNLVFIGRWDPTTETGSSFSGYDQNGKPPVQTLFDGCEIRNHNINVSTSGTVGSPGDGIGQHRMFFNDSVLAGHRQYNFIGGARHFAFTGCKVAQDVDAYNGPQNSYGEIRFGNFQFLDIQASDFYTKGGSSTLGNYEASQPNWRLDTDGVGNNYLNAQGNVVEGGRNIISTGSEGSRPLPTGTWVIEKNYLLASHTTRIGLLIMRPGMIVRNNIITIPDTTRNGSTPLANVYTLGGSPTKVPDAQEANRYEFVGNTVVIQLSGNYTIQSTQGTTAGHVVANNIVYTSSNQSDGPLNTATAFVAREKGYKDSITPQVAATATPPGSAWMAAPQSGAGAINGAVGSVAGYQIPYDDFLGQPRVQNFKGAVAPL